MGGLSHYIRNGLAYMDMRPPTQDEYDKFDHVIFTSDVTWDPTVLDDETDLTMSNDNLTVDIDEEYYNARSSDTGESTQRIIAEMLWDHCITNKSLSLSVLDHEDTLDFLASEKFFDALEHETKRMEPDYAKVQACLGYAPIEVMKKIFEKTTQFARNIVRLPFRTHLKSRFSALNVRRRNELVVMDTVWAVEPAVNDGSIAAQVFVGRNTYVTNVYGCKTDAEFAGILEDNICQRRRLSTFSGCTSAATT